MINTMTIDGYDAVIQYDPDIKLFRGEFVGLNGGADFYAKSVDGLEKEGRTSLKIFLQMCKEKGIEPRKSFSGKFVVRVPPELHARVTEAAAARRVSLNELVKAALERETSEGFA
jgi:predicted HicB family RNase H-like nuclease